MVATVQVYEANGGSDGAPGTKNRVDGQGVNAGTDVRYCTADAYNDGSSNPCIIPASGDNHSFWKHTYLNISGAAFTQVDNIRWYTDSAIGWTCGTGGGLYVGVRDAGDNGAPMDTEYDVATGTIGTTGHWMDDVTNGHSYYKDQTAPPADAATYTSASPLTVDTAAYTSADESDAVVTQVKIHDDATQGTQADETLTFVYDEI
ncbi:MAG: hypothetical protein U9Q68_03790 [Euryarchaeota archaeon]|nr:hypothetical protein [Euryarchaeota archaeon]